MQRRVSRSILTRPRAEYGAQDLKIGPIAQRSTDSLHGLLRPVGQCIQPYSMLPLIGQSTFDRLVGELRDKLVLERIHTRRRAGTYEGNGFSLAKKFT